MVKTVLPGWRSREMARRPRGASFGAAQRAGCLGGNIFPEGARAEAGMPSVRK